jgi:hypothetical protein
MTSGALSAGAPKQDLLLHVDDTNARQKAFQNIATDVELIKCRHCLSGPSAMRLIG